MKLVICGVVVAAGALYFLVDQRPGDVYPMSVAEAYDKLTAAKPEPMNGGQTQFTVVGDAPDKVSWSQRGSMSSFQCDMALEPYSKDPKQTHVIMTCNGGSMSDGAAAGMVHNMWRNEYIERVDAALTDRAVNMANAGATASRWPGDGVDGSLATATNNALTMAAAEGAARKAEDEARAAGPLPGQITAEEDLRKMRGQSGR